MHTQLEVIQGEKLYQTYKDKKILFSGNIAHNIGLRQRETVIKIGIEKTQGVVVSATMDEILVLAFLPIELKKKIYAAQGLVTINLKFFDPQYKKEMTFNLFTKLISIDNDGLDKKNMHYMSLQLLRKIPIDMINIFGKHHERISAAENIRKNKIETTLCSKGMQKVCFPRSIDSSSLLLDYPDDPQAFLKRKSIVILKDLKTKEVFEIIGSVDSEFVQMDEKCRIKVNYSMDQQSPRFSFSLETLKILINS